MRIIAGEMRGRPLKSVPGFQTRPTSDKVKGAIFSVLGEKVLGAHVLDLFAGTGNLGLEALSRGAFQGDFVEKRFDAWKVVQENINRLQTQRAHLYRMDAFDFLVKLPGDRVYDLIFLDPPYRQDLVSKALDYLQSPCRLTPGGVIIAETAIEEEYSDRLGIFEVRKLKEYGDTKVSFLQLRIQ